MEFKSGFAFDESRIPKNIESHKKRQLYKEKQEDADDRVFKTVCAFLNTKGGKIIFGVTDGKDIIGFSIIF